MTKIRSKIIGFGHYLPTKVVTNDELSQKVDTSDEWIRERTGIRQRHVAAEGQYTSDLAFEAAKMALAYAKKDISEVDGIILATTTPDNTFPSTATKLQAMLGMKHGFAFDVQAVCSGFLYALNVADCMIRGGQAKNLLVIGAETMSRILDWTDRNTCVLFGDGAGAILLSAGSSTGTIEDRGVLKVKMRSDGTHYDLLHTEGGPSTTQTAGKIMMNGKEVFKNAVINLHNVAKEVLAEVDLTTQDLDWLLPHQANFRIIDSTANKLGVDSAKVVLTVDRHANTSAASIPLALSEYVHAGKIKEGQLVIMDAMGAGFTWGAAIVRI